HRHPDYRDHHGLQRHRPRQAWRQKGLIWPGEGIAISPLNLHGTISDYPGGYSHARLLAGVYRRSNRRMGIYPRFTTALTALFPRTLLSVVAVRAPICSTAQQVD